MVDKNKLLAALDQIIDGFSQMRTALSPSDLFSTLSVPQPTEQLDDMGSFEKLHKALQSDRWPEAVNKNLVCDPNSETDKENRGRGIVELLIEESIANKKFLDYGCGDGHTTAYAAKKGASLTVGYDPQSFDWSKFKEPNLIYTTDPNVVTSNKPYDIVLLFEVIDHMKGEEPVAMLSKIANLLDTNGKVYVRTHPFTSRHGTHLYHSLNKAYAHLIFTPQELDQIVKERPYEEKNIGVIYPINTYTTYFDRAGLKIISKREIKEPVEPFFKIPKIAERIMQTTQTTSFPEFQMSIQFIDFILTKKDGGAAIPGTQSAGPQ